MGKPRDFAGKTPIINRPEFTVFIEYIPTQPGREYWLHCDVHQRWTPRVARLMKEVREHLLFLLDAPLFALVDYHNTKLAKFCEFVGMVETSVAEDERGHLLKQYVLYPNRNEGAHGI